MRATTATTVAIAVVALVIGIAVGALALGGAGGGRTVTVTATKTVTAAAGAGATTTITKTVTATTTVTKTVAAAAAPGLPKVVKIGALAPLTGQLASEGEEMKVAVEVAEEDINKFLEAVGAPFRVEVVVEDTETKPEVALQKLQAMAAKGVKLFVGPQTSAEVKQLKGFADQNKLLIVSPSSTDPRLAIAGDFVYRLCPTDLIQGPVIAKMAKSLGKKAMVIMWRGDAWGDGLHDAIRKAAEELGIEVVDGPRYDPRAPEFSAAVDQLASLVKSLVDKYGADKVAVVVISFNEVVQIFQVASQYDVLKKVQWLGSDGTALLDEVTADPVAAEFAATVKFYNTLFAATESPLYHDVVERIVKRLGRHPGSYALAAYDATWLLALSVLASGKYDAEVVKNALPEVVKHYFGVTGYIVLNEAGDRAFADYDVWGVVKTPEGKYVWERVGVYHFASDSFTWLVK